MSLSRARYIVAICALVATISSWFRYGEPMLSDTVEYTVAAYRLVNGEGYTLGINGGTFPPRYPPVFSVLFVSPAFVFTDELRYGALLPTILSAFAVIFVFETAALLSGTLAGLIAALCLLSIPSFLFFSGMAMTDCLLTAVSTFIAYLFVKEKKINSNFASTAAVLSALAFSLKSSSIFILIPWLLDRLLSRRWKDCVILLLPFLLTLAAGLAYNKIIFNDFFRTGYHYWVSVPYDFFTLTFSVDYLYANLKHFLIDSYIGIVLLFTIVMRKAKRIASDTLQRHFLQFVCLYGTPTLIFFSFYFYTDVRFYIPLAALVSIFFAVTTVNFLERIKPVSYKYQFIVATILVAYVIFKIPSSTKTFSLKEANSLLPSKSLVITDENPVILEHYFPEVEILPLSRRAEFAAKFIAEVKPPSSVKPISPFDHRNPKLKEYGARDVFNFTAEEQIGYVTDALSSGRNVYFLGTKINRSIFKDHLNFLPLTQYLFKITEEESHHSQG